MKWLDSPKVKELISLGSAGVFFGQPYWDENQSEDAPLEVFKHNKISK